MYGMFGYEHKTISAPPEGATSAYVSVAAGDLMRYSPGKPVMLLRWGFIATTTVNDAVNALKLSADLRVTAGSDSGRLRGRTFVVSAGSGYNAQGSPAIYMDYGGNGTTLGRGGGSITLTASASQLAAGLGVWHGVNPQVPTSSTVVGGIVTAIGGIYPTPQPGLTGFPGGGPVPPGGLPTQFIIYPGEELVIASNATAPGAGAGIVFAELIELPFTADGNSNSGAPTGVPSSIVPTPSEAGSDLTLVRA